MPIYEYRCNKCGNVFEQLVFPSDSEDFECPACGNKDNSRIVSSFSSGTSSGNGINPAGSLSSGCSPSGGFS